MVHILPPYRTYQAACRGKNYKASVPEALRMQFTGECVSDMIDNFI